MEMQVNDARLERRTVLAGSLMFALVGPLTRAVRAAGLDPQVPVDPQPMGGRAVKVNGQLVKVPYYGGIDTFIITSNIDYSNDWGYSGVALIKHPDSKLTLVEIEPIQLKMTHVSTEILVRPTELVTSDFRFAWSVNGGQDQYKTELSQLLTVPDAAFRRTVTSYTDETLRAWVAYYALSKLA